MWITSLQQTKQQFILLKDSRSAETLEKLTVEAVTDCCRQVSSGRLGKGLLLL